MTRPSSSVPVEAAGRLALAAVVGGLVGGLTQWSVLHLPWQLRPLSYSAAPWIVIIFLVALLGRRPRESGWLALVSLLTMIASFYAAQSVRGWPVSGDQLVFWAIAALIVGPVVGLAAGWSRYAGPVAAGSGAGVVGGMVAGEALHGLIALRFSTLPEYWHVQIAIGLSLTVALTLHGCRHRLSASAGAWGAAVGLCLLVTLGTLLVYHAPSP